MSGFKDFHLTENWLVFAIMGMALLVLGFFGWQSVNKNDVPPPEPSPAELSFASTATTTTYTDIRGNSMDLSKYLGKVVIATSWASWCRKCKDDLTALAKLRADYDDNEVVILAINRAESKTAAERYLNSVSSEKPPLLILDQEDRFYQSIQGYTMPETVVYSKTGEILYHAHGAVNVERLRSQLDLELKI